MGPIRYTAAVGPTRYTAAVGPTGGFGPARRPPGKLAVVIARMTALLIALLVMAGLVGAPASASPPDPPGTLTFGGLQRP